MAQMYRFTDENGQVRLFAEIDPSPAGTPFNGGTITQPLTITVDHTRSGTTPVLELDNDTPETLLILNLRGDLQVFPSPTGQVAGGPVLEIGNLSSGNAFRVNNDGTTFTGVTALATQQYVSGNGATVGGDGVDARTFTPVTFNPSAGAAATCAVAVSPTGSVYTTLWTETVPVGVVFDGTIRGLNVFVPGTWRLRFTAVNATLGLTTYY